MSRVLILTLVFPPDNVSTAQIMGDLAEDLQKLGHDVSVITTTPHYNDDAGATLAQPLKRDGRWYMGSEFRGIPVIHARMPRKGRSLVKRVLSWLGFHVLSTWRAFRLSPQPDVIIVPSPPLTIGISAWLIARHHRAKYVYNVQEIYPDLAVKLGIITNPAVIAVLRRLERFVYDRAAAMTVIGVGMRRSLLAKGVAPSKVEVIPNFVDVTEMAPSPKRNPFSIAHGMVDKFVVSYAGNMGLVQGLEAFVDAAALLQDRQDVLFAMIGDGVMRGELMERASKLGLQNVRFVPQQPYSAVPHIYAATDISLVALAVDTGGHAIPSKVYRIMACACPILAVTDATSELAEVVAEAQCGSVTTPGNPEELAAIIRSAADDPEAWRRKGESGRAFVLQRFERSAVTRLYSDLVTRLSTP